MKYKIIEAGFLVFIFSSSLFQCFSQSEQLIDKYPEYSFENTEVRILHSKIVRQDYEILISLPDSYFEKDTVYPVIFLLDPTVYSPW